MIKTVTSYLVGALLGAAMVLAGWYWHQGKVAAAVQAGIAADRAVWQEQARVELAAANERALRAETAAAMAALENQIAEQERDRKAAADRQRSADELDRMRHLLAAMLSGASTDSDGARPISLVDAAPALARALGECSSRYQEVAAAADAAVNQVLGLQAYVMGVVAKACTLDSAATIP